jgi:hypothetical protein
MIHNSLSKISTQILVVSGTQANNPIEFYMSR